MKNLVIVLLILYFLFYLTAGQSAAEEAIVKSGAANTQDMQSQNADALKKGCEMTVHIKSTYAEGDFKILAKEGFSRKGVARILFINAPVKYGVVATAKKSDPSNTVTWMTEDGKRVLDSIPGSSLYHSLLNEALYPVMDGGDVLVVSYKDKQKETDVFHHIKYLQAMERRLGRDKFLHGFNFTYDDLINAVSKLINQDELQLSGDSITVKKRDIKELPDDRFTLHFGFSPKNRVSPVPPTD
jgi:hypothetical protein